MTRSAPTRLATPTRLAFAAALAVTALATAGCASVVQGHNTTVSRATAFPSSPTPTPSTSVPSPSATAPPAPVSAPGSATPAAKALLTRLEAAPAGSTAPDDAWSRNLTPTLAQFVTWDYTAADVAYEEQRLRSQGLVAIVHRDWVASNGDEGDVVLLQFRTAQGATSRFLAASQAKSEQSGQHKFALPAPPAGARSIGLYSPQLDSYGNVRSIVYAVRGTVEMQTFGYTAPKLNSSELATWTNDQLVRL